MLKYKQYSQSPMLVQAGITVSAEKLVCAQVALLFVDRETERATIFATLGSLNDF
jgi:hypothetical protein